VGIKKCSLRCYQQQQQQQQPHLRELCSRAPLRWENAPLVFILRTAAAAATTANLLQTPDAILMPSLLQRGAVENALAHSTSTEN
jgi:hypothetical protein